MTQMDLNYCAGLQAGEAAGLLDRLLLRLRSELYQDQWVELREVQSEWEELLDRDCDWEASLFEGGSILPMVRSLCRRDRYYDRINRLRFLLCDGGMTLCAAAGEYAITPPVLVATSTPTPPATPSLQ